MSSIRQTAASDIKDLSLKDIFSLFFLGVTNSFFVIESELFVIVR